MSRLYNILFTGVIIFFIVVMALALVSCSRQTYTITPVKISTVGDRVHIQPTGKSQPVGDTTVTGWLISKQVTKHNRRMRQ